MKKIFVTALLVILLCGTWTKNAAAQTNTTPQPAARFIGWGTNEPNSHEVAVTAIIQQVVPNHVSGIPTGLHLMLGTPQGVLDASIGPYLSKEIQEALIAGKSVQVIGKVQTIREQKYLFVRQLLLNGQQITIRNEHGSLVRARSVERTHSQTLQNGGIQ